jgi:hypothetical protein
MRTIETTATVTKDGKMTIQIPPDIEPGEHKVVLVIEEQLVKKETRPPLICLSATLARGPRISLSGVRTRMMNGVAKKIFLDTNVLVFSTAVCAPLHSITQPGKRSRSNMPLEQKCGSAGKCCGNTWPLSVVRKLFCAALISYSCA